MQFAFTDGFIKKKKKNIILVVHFTLQSSLLFITPPIAFQNKLGSVLLVLLKASKQDGSGWNCRRSGI